MAPFAVLVFQNSQFSLAKHYLGDIFAVLKEMQELICSIEFDKEDEEGFLAKLRTEMGGLREFTGRTFDEVLNLVVVDLEEEFL